DLELPDHVDGQHFGAIGTVELGMDPRPRKVAEPELAVAIDGGGPHQIADFQELAHRRLLAACKASGDMVEEPERLVRPRQDELAGPAAPSLLSRHVAREACQVLVSRFAI